MEKSGIKFVATPADLKKELQKDAETVWKSLAGDVYTDEELKLVLKYRDEFRKK